MVVPGVDAGSGECLFRQPDFILVSEYGIACFVCHGGLDSQLVRKQSQAHDRGGSQTMASSQAHDHEKKTGVWVNRVWLKSSILNPCHLLGAFKKLHHPTHKTLPPGKLAVFRKKKMSALLVGFFVLLLLLLLAALIVGGFRRRRVHGRGVSVVGGESLTEAETRSGTECEPCSEESSVCEASVACDTGPVGCSGPRGQRGVIGKRGSEGCRGETGDTGPQGCQGYSGRRGPQGPQGARGQQGLIGPPGLQGPQGGQGVIGPEGNDAKCIVAWSTPGIIEMAPADGKRLTYSFGMAEGGTARVLDPDAPDYNTLFVDISFVAPRDMTITAFSACITGRETTTGATQYFIIPDVVGGVTFAIYLAPPASDVFTNTVFPFNIGFTAAASPPSLVAIVTGSLFVQKDTRVAVVMTSIKDIITAPNVGASDFAFSMMASGSLLYS